jgi:indole-3-glycerol phosphate synthase/phosphoribosylanthranilate isomerase
VIASRFDPVAAAGEYLRQGARTVSVLTEPGRFGGSLEHLRRVKEAYPGLCVLRKDFLLDRGDLEVSRRAGADAVLLIAALHAPRELARLYREASGMGLGVLLEVHSREDAARAAAVRPRFTGVNSRNLNDFTVDPAHPIALRSVLTWDTTAVYESGVTCAQEARAALSSGFDGLLVGEAVMRDPGLIPSLASAFSLPRRDFWLRLFARRNGVRTPGFRPLVKICGITSPEDARAACDLGADLLGFVLADSPRRADPFLVEELGPLPVLKVGVTVHRAGDRTPDPAAAELLERGLLDAVQLHGDELPGDCGHLGFPWYKAVRLRPGVGAAFLSRYPCPRVLADAYVAGVPGGTGRQVNPGLAAAAAGRRPLWLAGGLGPENIRETLRLLAPELVDASSMLEAEPGRKDHARLRAFFGEIERYARETGTEAGGTPGENAAVPAEHDRGGAA